MARPTSKQPVVKPVRADTAAEEIRLFVASPLPNQVVDHLGHLLDDLSSRNLPVRWTDSRSLHLTYHFIGDTRPERAELVRLAFANLTPHSGTIKLQTDRLGVFPDEKRPRVLWIGLKGQTDRLTVLHEEISQLLDRIGVPVEDRKFRPHLTLGRARDKVGPEFAKELQRVMADSSVQEFIESPIDLTISDVRLYRSVIERSGPRHEALATVGL